MHIIYAHLLNKNEGYRCAFCRKAVLQKYKIKTLEQILAQIVINCNCIKLFIYISLTHTYIHKYTCIYISFTTHNIKTTDKG